MLIKDEKTVSSLSKQEGVEIWPIAKALAEFKEIDKYFGRLIRAKKDAYVAKVYDQRQSGYFIRIVAGVKAKLPTQACLYIKKSNFEQRVHNIIIAEENSELEIISGCLTGQSAQQAIHLGISEIFVKKEAKLTLTMVHKWNKTTKVRPRTAIKVEDGGLFVSNYVCLDSVKDLQMKPVCYLEGDKSRANFNSLVYAPPQSQIDLGVVVYLRGKNSRAKIASKIVCNQAKVINRGRLVGQGEKSKAHLECGGLIVSKRGMIRAIPEIEGQLANSDLSHEASIGQLSAEAIEYLMARGLSRDKAVSLLISGFLSLPKFKLPKEVEKEIGKIDFRKAT
ncbi:SufD family Fe-S cluster assembly protein [Candidatus Shapirobacteria bacterium]|nr:MAG: SufD family Fe-S cluster assembly protein [Candidatus Shapirobacteria bacterium]